jgi:hypothetical protein
MSIAIICAEGFISRISASANALAKMQEDAR